MRLPPACLPLLLPALLSACIIVPLPEETAKQVPFAIPIRIGGGTGQDVATNAPIPAPVCARTVQPALSETALLAEVNRVRSAQGLGAITLSPRLNVTAQDQACQIAASQRLGHRDGTGRDTTARASAAGYGWRHIAENVGMGTVATPADIVALWMRSPGHRSNLLHSGVTEAGFGYAVVSGGQPGWSLVLAQPR